MSSDNPDIRDVLNQASMARELSPREKELRIKFVDEYYKDFNAKRACIRIGYEDSFAGQYATQFLGEPFVQQQIALRAEKPIGKEEQKEEDEKTKRVIRARLLAESNYHGPGSSHAARVSALKQLADLYGMEAPKVIKNEHLHRGGVMQVPGIANADAWEDQAIASQESLVNNARH